MLQQTELAQTASAPNIFQQNCIAEFSPQKEQWTLWNKRLEIYFAEINCTNENIKKASLLKNIGSASDELLHNLCSPASPISKTYKELCAILKTQYTPPTIIFRERKIFHSAVQSEIETVSEWYARVKKLALTCKFGENLSAFILDRFIMGIKNKIFERLCEEDENLTIEQALRKALIIELRLSEQKSYGENVNYINNNNDVKPKYNKTNGSYKNIPNKNIPNKVQNNKSTKTFQPCAHCGWRNHVSNECYYKSCKCHQCGRIGHLSSICKKNTKVVNKVSSIKVKDHIDNRFCIYSINQKGEDSTELYSVTINFNGISMDVVCDSGAPCSLIPKYILNRCNKTVSLKNCIDPYVDYNGNHIKVLGEYFENIEYNGINKKIKLVVTNNNSSPLLGRNFLRAFGFELIQVNSINCSSQYAIFIEQIKNEFIEIFDGDIGTYKLARISLPMEKDFKPVFFKPRPVPLAWKSKIESNLRELIAKDILEPINNAEWGTPLVPILKPNGDIRICGDYKVTINKHLSDFKYPLPRIDEIFASLQGGELFSKLDLLNAYNQLVLDDKSQLLCTWSTHIGTLKMKHLPFEFVWSEQCDKTYEMIKKDITSDKVLVHFNPKLPIVLTTDASNKAVAGILSHKFSEDKIKPIAFVSRALSKAEQNYSTLEKEALAIIFCGHTNDADNLSRIPQAIHRDQDEGSSFINYIQSENILSIDFKDIARETRRDPILSKVCDAVRKGIVKTLKDEKFTAFTSKDTELTVDQDCLLWGYRVIIPLKLRTSILQSLHESHLGIVKTKSLARSFVWWPKLDRDIENLIKSCLPCQKLLPSPEKSKLIPWTVTNTVWQRIHIDFAGPIKNYHLFVIIDSFSKWVEVFKTKDITSNFVITKLRETFSRFGIAETLLSDNGRQFVSEEFKNFVNNNKINHILTAPGHPSTNGQAENFIKSLKKSLYATLNDESPAQIFLGISIRTRFDLIKPPLVRDRIIQKQRKSVSNYRGKRNEQFEIGQNVYVRDYSNVNKKSWIPAIIKDKLGPRLYCCIMSNNRVIKRHLDQIKSGPGESLVAHNSSVDVQDVWSYSPSCSNIDTLSTNVEPSQYDKEIQALGLSNKDYSVDIQNVKTDLSDENVIDENVVSDENVNKTKKINSSQDICMRETRSKSKQKNKN
ncbi:uncharacterized protein K02A2.6-like [Teleopsis dalmanni]|uniref:uncharacterized protein K02A2.6-like n=1 Tax=Teleopsis dalmanni TaxID=139649 RepID=UPI0018CD2DE5|nr:uncharacterized protein K02A2.6-like [Teleopsis dalmanni]